MEDKIRFYYNTSEYDKIIDHLKEVSALHSSLKLYEYAIQYNHYDPQYDFYGSEVEGKFRIKISRNELSSKCKVTWRERVKDEKGKVSEEIKKEVKINPDDIDNFIYIVENVMHFRLVESYERNRVIFENNDVEVAVDEYPFGVCIQIESKSHDEKPEDIVKYWVKELGLNLSDGTTTSWDDKYEKLCIEQNIDSYREVTFDKKMPQIKNLFKVNK